MNFNESSNYSDEIGLKYIKTKYPNSQIRCLNEIDPFAPADFIVKSNNKVYLVEVKLRNKLYSEPIIEKNKLNNMKLLLEDILSNKMNINKNYEGELIYLNVVNDYGYFFDLNTSKKRYGYLNAPKHSASDGNNQKTIKEVYFLDIIDADKVTLS
jgi:hypothetical protein